MQEHTPTERIQMVVGDGAPGRLSGRCSGFQTNLRTSLSKKIGALARETQSIQVSVASEQSIGSVEQRFRAGEGASRLGRTFRFDLIHHALKLWRIALLSPMLPGNLEMDVEIWSTKSLHLQKSDTI